MRCLLDTCVISELTTKIPNPKVVEYLDALDPGSTFLSVISIGEIQKGISKMPSSKRKTQLRQWFNDFLLVRFSQNLLDVDVRTMLVWGDLRAELESKGRPMSTLDSVIAAQARLHDQTLVTRNVNDFAGAGVQIENPWR
ncbi:MAG TPA: type II toxin-antitoxin system VapC family toxin [Tepidisphaeraceae bacterium]|jgi:tRNA(fMet)-specific endonuclease VapC